MSARRRSHGFTLLETLAALAILGLALPAILSAFSDAIARVAGADDRLETLRRAQDLLVLAAARYPEGAGGSSGEDDKVAWRLEAVRLDPHDGEVGREAIGTIPVRLSVGVRSKRGTETHLDTLFLYQEPRR